MTWKQLIPTDLDLVFGDDYASCLLYRELIYRSANRDGFFTDSQTNRTIPIKRGQVVFGQHQWAKYLCWSSSTTYRTLQKLEKIYQKVNNSPQKGFTLVTVINYDDIIDLNNTRITSEYVVNTSKHIKEKENIKEKEKIPLPKLEGRVDPLPYEKIYQIASKLKVNLDDVLGVQDNLLLSIEDGNKYGIKVLSLALSKWVTRALTRGEISTRNEVEDLIFAHKSPENMAKDVLFEQQLKIKYPDLV